MPDEIPITIIGAGIVGCAIAYELSRNSTKQIVVVERNRKVEGDNQSSRNSGVIHAGIYYPRDIGLLKARLCTKGNSLLYDFCEEYRIPHKKTGKLVVATNPAEETYLDDLLCTAQENGVPGVTKIDAQAVRRYEPNVAATAALYVPTTGIIEPTSLVRKLRLLAEKNGVIFAAGTKVIAAASTKNGFKNGFSLITETGGATTSIETRLLINAAGLYSDEIARMVNPDSQFEMAPVRGEAAKFSQTKRSAISMNGLNVYPVPWGVLQNGDRFEGSFEEFQQLFLYGQISKSVGAHLTPTFDFADGEYTIGTTVAVGPVYVGNVGKDDYRQTRDATYYLHMVKPFFPNLELSDLTLHQAGVRARLKGHYDFVIQRDNKFPACINLIGIDSPGLTSCLAIAQYVGDLLNE